jgi:tryptophan synthase alpha chain
VNAAAAKQSPPVSGLANLQRVFADLRARKRKALVIYVMAGDPDPDFTARLVPKLAGAGADVVELGFPFSDPVADGPVIQAAGQRALHNFATLGEYFAMVRRIRAQSAVPLVTMTYYNPIFRYGEAKFLSDGRTAGLDGTIIPDLPVVEAATWVQACTTSGMAPIFLEAPNSPVDAAQRMAELGRGFIYLVSLKGVTGQDSGMGENLQERVQRFRQWTETPTVVGFGISTPEQAKRMGTLCDGIVVGSGVVQRIADARSPDAAEIAVLDYVRAMRAGLDGA